MNKARKITFPNVGIIEGSRVWRNSETGVEIIKGKNFKEVGLYYVCVPTAPGDHDDKAGRRMVALRTTLAGARDVAAARVRAWRHVIAEAYVAAGVEDSQRSASNEDEFIRDFPHEFKPPTVEHYKMWNGSRGGFESDDEVMARLGELPTGCIKGTYFRPCSRSADHPIHQPGAPEPTSDPDDMIDNE